MAGGSEETEQDHFVADPRARRLVVVWEGGTVARRLPDSGTLVLGRAVESDVAIDHKSVSRRHAILHVGTELAIEDLGGANGTRVRGARVEAGRRVPFAVGEVVELGSTVAVVQGRAAAAPEKVAPASRPATTSRVVVVDPAMHDLYRLVAMVSKSPVNVLVVGETGAGKDVVAHEVHRLSPRASGPFVSLNCAAMPESLLESELFGYEKGAFTGADRAKPGFLEAAHGGTLFLDELGEMPLATQAKLLRVVEAKEVTRLGATKSVAVDVRIVSATNADVEQRVAAGAFRADLYYRLNGITLAVPPLRARPDEIGPLAQAFLAAQAGAVGAHPPELSAEALLALRAHPWPGNVRELKNVMAQAFLFADGARRIEPAHLRAMTRAASLAPPAPPPGPAPTAPSAAPAAPLSVTDAGLRGELDALERARIVEALERCSGNQTRAAELLGISRRTLLNRLDAYGLPRPRKA